MITGKPGRGVKERQIDLQSKAIRGLVLGSGLLLVSILAFALSPRGLVITLFALAFAFVFLSSAVARFFQARSLHALDRADERPALPSSQTEFIKPLNSIYETDDLTPVSVTEHTTKHLNRTE
jgi:hypothetical protein